MLGSQVFVESHLYTGTATVTHIIEGEMFPIQLLLDKENDLGAKTYRVSTDELGAMKTEVKEIKKRYNHEIPQRQKTPLEAHWDVVKYKGEYLVVKPSNGSVASCYDFKGYFKGKLRLDTFNLIGPYADYKDNLQNTVELQAEEVVEVTAKVVKSRKKEKYSVGEQLSLF